ncbi:hypothetical protein [Actinacidiphila sp. bgisy144]|uniref:hypothetical protein n=1 Tax=Actinacidiphila sp. bgisy144 TaxID=3413791 RepID=UPI003EBB96A2
MRATERTRKSAAAVIAVLAMAAAGCGGSVSHGKESPDAVEKKARSLAQQTLDAVRGAAGSAGTSAGGSTWGKCATETPGQHRFEFRYTLKLDVGEEKSTAVMAAAKAHFVKQGYDLDLPDPKTDRVGGTEPDSSWWVGVGVNSDDDAMFISVDSDCVTTSHDPRTA